jgi:branched-chain amino acid transport system substrate-binding protein
MVGSVLGRTRGSARVIAACLALLLAFGAAACGDTEGGLGPGSDDSVFVADDALGEPNTASGTPVSIGLITNGGDCPDCTSGTADERPTAEATVAWANEYLGGIGGHPIELEVCVDDIDPSKAADCANQMIQADVAAVVIGSNGVISSSWEILHDAGIPVLNFSATEEAMLQDDQSTFILQDPVSVNVDLPIAIAERIDADQVSVIVVDLPIATEVYEGEGARSFEAAGIDLEVVPVPLGTPDMTPQARQIVSDNPDGVVMIVGHDAFCIPAIDGLIAAGFRGTIGTISFCTTAAMVEAIPPEVLNGLVVAATSPIGDDSDASMLQFHAVLNEYATSDIDRTSAGAVSMFSSFGALALGTQGLDGEATPESIIAALRAMEHQELPAGGGRYFRCNGNASEANPASCTVSVLSATLDSLGRAASYEVVNDQVILD